MAELIKREKLLFGLPIEIPNMGTVYPPKLKDFFNKNFEYGRFKRIFSIRKEIYLDENSKNYDELKDFDLIVLLNMSGDLIEGLKMLYKTDEVKFETPKHDDINSIKISIKVDDNIYYIDRNNYTKFADIILIILHEGRNIADEEIKKELSEIELKMERKKREFEKKKAQREAEIRKKNNQEDNVVTLYDLANYIIHADGSNFDYQSVLDLTVYQIMNTFNLYKQKENYKLFMDYKTSGNFQIEDKMNHWFFNN